MGVKQSEDQVIRDAKNQMETCNMVTEGPLRNQVNLRVVNGLLYRGNQLLAPESM